MKASELVLSELTVIVDDYDSGEVIYEGTVHGDYVMGRWLSGYEKGVSWEIRDGKPFAFVTIVLGEKYADYKRMVETREAYDAFLSDPAIAVMDDDERKVFREEAKRLWHEHFHAKAAFEGWEPIE